MSDIVLLQGDLHQVVRAQLSVITLLWHWSACAAGLAAGLLTNNSMQTTCSLVSVS